jgi:osmoprotectant transport system permease protein
MDAGEDVMDIFLGSLEFMASHFGLLGDKTLEHIVISVVPIIVSAAVGLPIGCWLGHLHRGEFLAVSLTNIGRALPSLALIAILIGLVGIGYLNAMLALVLLAFPPALSYAFVAINGVDRQLTKAARGMGLSAMQVFFKVEMPLGSSMIMEGIRTASVLTISSATLASISGGGGLGDVILNQVAYGMEGVIAGAIWVALLAIVVDQVLAFAGKLLVPRGTRMSVQVA